jgi:hypothetical protein
MVMAVVLVTTLVVLLQGLQENVMIFDAHQPLLETTQAILYLLVVVVELLVVRVILLKDMENVVVIQVGVVEPITVRYQVLATHR